MDYKLVKLASMIPIKVKEIILICRFAVHTVFEVRFSATYYRIVLGPSVPGSFPP